MVYKLQDKLLVPTYMNLNYYDAFKIKNYRVFIILNYMGTYMTQFSAIEASIVFNWRFVPFYLRITKSKYSITFFYSY